MIGVRLLTRQAVAKALREEGCERVVGHDIPNHSVWKTRWGFHFFVPERGPDKRTADYVLAEIIADVRKSRGQ